MEKTLAACLWLLGGALVILALVALRRPVRWLGAVAARTGLGLGVLAAVSPVGAALGLDLGVNLWNALVMGLLGAPGFGLLALLQWAVR